MRGVGDLPLPQTLAGALRTHVWRQLGVNFEHLAERVWQELSAESDLTTVVAALLPAADAWAAYIKMRGPWLAIAQADSTTPRPLIPMPADLATVGKKSTEGEIIRLRPRQHVPPGWHPLQPGMVPFWEAEHADFEPAQGYLTLDGVQCYLDGDIPDKAQQMQPNALYAWEDRVGIAVEADRNRAEDHMLYSVRLLRLHRGVSFYAEVEVDDAHAVDAKQWLQGTLAFGGEGRRAQVTVLSEPVTWPQPTATGAGMLAVLLTPGIFGLQTSPSSDVSPWRPERANLPPLMAAAVPGHRAIAGWDMARGHAKPTRFAVLEGSVYCFAGMLPDVSGSPLLHLNQSELDTLGYGLALKGVWQYA